MKTKMNDFRIKTIWVLALAISISSSYGQMSGNRAYEKNNNYKTVQNGNGFTLTDGNLSFKVKVLMNKKAGNYLITLGLNEEANSIEICNKLINERISKFNSNLLKSGIKKEDLYVDFVSQTKIYDYALEPGKAEQFEKGFEIKKNIIIKTNSLKNIDLIIETASVYKIYNVIKVDYLSDETSAIYATLFDEALKIAEIKKNNYLTSFNKRTVGNPVASDEFEVITPETQYKDFQAFETSDYETNYRNNSNLKKIARKDTTFYYDGISSAGFDKVINNATPIVGIQYFLTLTITYKLDTSL